MELERLLATKRQLEAELDEQLKASAKLEQTLHRAKSYKAGFDKEYSVIKADFDKEYSVIKADFDRKHGELLRQFPRVHENLEEAQRRDKHCLAEIGRTQEALKSVETEIKRLERERLERLKEEANAAHKLYFAVAFE